MSESLGPMKDNYINVFLFLNSQYSGIKCEVWSHTLRRHELTAETIRKLSGHPTRWVASFWLTIVHFQANGCCLSPKLHLVNGFIARLMDKYHLDSDSILFKCHLNNRDKVE